MVLTLFSLVILATSSMGTLMPQPEPVIAGVASVVNNLVRRAPAATTPPPSTTSIRCNSRYTSQEHDTCASIGRPWGLSGDDILAANTFLNCADIWPGTPICIPFVEPTTTSAVPRCQQTYTSVEKDTCDSIGTHFGLSGNDIRQANTFLNCNDIWPYTPICIPYVATTSPTTTSRLPSSTTSASPSCQSWVSSLKGDTCDKLAERYYVSRDAIYNANSFLNCDDIWTNTPICVPFQGPTTTTSTSPTSTSMPSQTTVSPTATSTSVCPTATNPSCFYWFTNAGETCDSLARDASLASSDIQAANPFLSCNNIWPNTQICIPPTSSVPGCKHISHIQSWLVVPGSKITCETVAIPWALEASDIHDSNAFINCDDIWVGTPICIPWKTPY